jgi:hypothetical protein
VKMELNRKHIKKHLECSHKIASSLKGSWKQRKLSGTNKLLRPGTHLASVFRVLFKVNSVHERSLVFQNR